MEAIAPMAIPLGVVTLAWRIGPPPLIALFWSHSLLRMEQLLSYIHAEVQHAVVGQAASVAATGDALPLSSQHGSSPQPASAAGVSVGEFPSIMVYTICNGLGYNVSFLPCKYHVNVLRDVSQQEIPLVYCGGIESAQDTRTS